MNPPPISPKPKESEMLKITDLPQDITPPQIIEVAQGQYRLLLQNDQEGRLNEERHFREMMNQTINDEDFDRYLARKKEINANRQAYLDLLDQLKELHEKATR